MENLECWHRIATRNPKDLKAQGAKVEGHPKGQTGIHDPYQGPHPLNFWISSALEPRVWFCADFFWNATEQLMLTLWHCVVWIGWYYNNVDLRSLSLWLKMWNFGFSGSRFLRERKSSSSKPRDLFNLCGNVHLLRTAQKTWEMWRKHRPTIFWKGVVSSPQHSDKILTLHPMHPKA